MYQEEQMLTATRHLFQEEQPPVLKKAPRWAQGGWSSAVTPGLNNTGFCVQNYRESLQTIKQWASSLTREVYSEK